MERRSGRCSSSYHALNSSSMPRGGLVMVSRSPLLGGRAIGDASFFECIRTVRDPPRECAALLGEQHRHAGLLEIENRSRYLLDHYGGEPLRGLVEQDRARV